MYQGSNSSQSLVLSRLDSDLCSASNRFEQQFIHKIGSFSADLMWRKNHQKIMHKFMSVQNRDNDIEQLKKKAEQKKKMVTTRVELATLALLAPRSNQLERLLVNCSEAEIVVVKSYLS